jgi:hypothetical protein
VPMRDVPRARRRNTLHVLGNVAHALSDR